MDFLVKKRYRLRVQNKISSFTKDCIMSETRLQAHLISLRSQYISDVCSAQESCLDVNMGGRPLRKSDTRVETFDAYWGRRRWACQPILKGYLNGVLIVNFKREQGYCLVIICLCWQIIFFSLAIQFYIIMKGNILSS